MSSVAVALPSAPITRRCHANREPAWVRWLLIGLALAFLAGFLFMPLAVVFIQAFSKGWSVYWSALAEPNALAAIRRCWWPRSRCQPI